MISYQIKTIIKLYFVSVNYYLINILYYLYNIMQCGVAWRSASYDIGILSYEKKSFKFF